MWGCLGMRMEMHISCYPTSTVQVRSLSPLFLQLFFSSQSLPMRVSVLLSTFVLALTAAAAFVPAPRPGGLAPRTNAEALRRGLPPLKARVCDAACQAQRLARRSKPSETSLPARSVQFRKTCEVLRAEMYDADNQASERPTTSPVQPLSCRRRAITPTARAFRQPSTSTTASVLTRVNRPFLSVSHDPFPVWQG